MDERPKCQTGIHQNHSGEPWRNHFDIGYSNFLLDMFQEARESKAKNELLALHQEKKLLYSKGNSQQNQKTTDRIEDTYKCHIR